MSDEADKEKKPEASVTYGKRPFVSAVQISIGQAVSNVKGLAALIAMLGVLTVSYYAFETKLGLQQPWPAVVIVCFMVAFLLVYFIPTWLDLRKQKALEVSGIKGELKNPTYFRLVPYEASDAASFSRPDGAGAAVVNWIISNPNRLLYLSGRSGVGKSSLINAVIVPKLGDAGYIVVPLRPYNDLAGSMSNELLRPECIWSKPPAPTGNVVELVRRAAARVRQNGKRLLIIIDQFEEVLILGTEQTKSDVAKLLLALNNGSIDGFLVMLSLGAEYLSDVIDLGLPNPAFGSRENAFEVRPFTRASAEAFIENSGLKLGAKLVQTTMAEASEIEDMPDRVRPIVLNMLGLVIGSFKGSLPRSVKAGSLLEGYVRRSVNANIARISIKVLRPLVTTVGTKRAQTTEQIAEDAKLPGLEVRGCLIALANDGLVRRLPGSEERWEVAHDFVARLLQRLLPPPLPVFQSFATNFLPRFLIRISMWAVVILGALFPSVYASHAAVFPWDIQASLDKIVSAGLFKELYYVAIVAALIGISNIVYNLSLVEGYIKGNITNSVFVFHPGYHNRNRAI